ncbi:hypothetical protein RB195_016697 [Necator americanus]|uniref:Uncharacterized protein n=1 Tax=Necator americanus TaxID=51031 RepID=A0ABR1C3Z7_NECAM
MTTWWKSAVHVLCVISAMVFIVATIMLALYVIRLICNMAIEPPIPDIESSAYSKSDRRRSKRSARSPRSSRRSDRSSRRSKRSPSRSDRETPPSSRYRINDKVRTVNLVLRGQPSHSSGTEQNVSAPSPSIRPQGKPIEFSGQKIQPAESGSISTTGSTRASNAPSGKDSRADAAGSIAVHGSVIGADPKPQGITFNVEPGTPISVNVQGPRAYAGGTTIFCFFVPSQLRKVEVSVRQRKMARCSGSMAVTRMKKSCTDYTFIHLSTSLIQALDQKQFVPKARKPSVSPNYKNEVEKKIVEE